MDEVRRLIKYGANVNHQDHKGKTALHRAAKSGFIETMKVLIELGATIDVKDEKGETALFDAIRSTIKKVDLQKKAIELLVNSGADLSLANRRKQTPAELVRATKRLSRTKVARLFS